VRSTVIASAQRPGASALSIDKEGLQATALRAPPQIGIDPVRKRRRDERRCCRPRYNAAGRSTNRWLARPGQDQAVPAVGVLTAKRRDSPGVWASTSCSSPTTRWAPLVLASAAPDIKRAAKVRAWFAARWTAAQSVARPDQVERGRGCDSRRRGRRFIGVVEACLSRTAEFRLRPGNRSKATARPTSENRSVRCCAGRGC